MKGTGDRTRAKLLEAATLLFSERGLDGVSTRDIARAAEATLPSIPYHYGSKEGLYRAVLSAMVEEIAAILAPAAAEAEAFLAGPETGHDAVLEALITLLRAQGRAVLTHSRPAWSALNAQRQSHPPAMVSGLPRPFETHVLEPASRLIGRLRDLPPDSVPVKLQTLALCGRQLMFKTHRATLRFMGWPDLTDALITAMLDEQMAEVRLVFRR